MIIKHAYPTSRVFPLAAPFPLATNPLPPSSPRRPSPNRSASSSRCSLSATRRPKGGPKWPQMRRHTLAFAKTLPFPDPPFMAAAWKISTSCVDPANFPWTPRRITTDTLRVFDSIVQFDCRLSSLGSGPDGRESRLLLLDFYCTGHTSAFIARFNSCAR